MKRFWFRRTLRKIFRIWPPLKAEEIEPFITRIDPVDSPLVQLLKTKEFEGLPGIKHPWHDWMDEPLERDRYMPPTEGA